MGTLQSGRLLEAYERMVLIRCFEERVHRLFNEGVLHGTVHLCAGQEAVAVGVCMNLREDDVVVSNHRGHGHLLAKGGDPRRLMAELFGRLDGYSKGRGGSQHIMCRDVGFMGANGITGGGIPLAVGEALAFSMRGESRVVACFFGDGASNQGTFHESLNMAALWNLPVLFVCENNMYAMSTRLDAAVPTDTVAVRAAAYGMPGVVVDGNDVVSVATACAVELDRMRRGGGPALIECRTYRFFGHSRSDRLTYRSRDEESWWRERDPLSVARDHLVRMGVLTSEEAEVVRRRMEELVDDAVSFAQESPVPDESAHRLEAEVFAP